MKPCIQNDSILRSPRKTFALHHCDCFSSKTSGQQLKPHKTNKPWTNCHLPVTLNRNVSEKANYPKTFDCINVAIRNRYVFRVFSIRYTCTISHKPIWKIMMHFRRNFRFPLSTHWYKWICSSAHMRNSSQFLVITVDRIIRPSYLACCVLTVCRPVSCISYTDRSNGSKSNKIPSLALALRLVWKRPIVHSNVVEICKSRRFLNSSTTPTLSGHDKVAQSSPWVWNIRVWSSIRCALRNRKVQY